jgi:cellulose synthase/poly-beta-1,6-N-acetylglucosamine synthase-like glycosyltransferase
MVYEDSFKTGKAEINRERKTRSCSLNQKIINESNWDKKREYYLSLLGIIITLLACWIVAWEQLPLFAEQLTQQEWGHALLHVFYIMIIASLIYGSLVYQFTRLAYILRRRRNHFALEKDLLKFYNQPAPTLTILIPSYKEESRVIWQTLISAALQEYPHKRVVLLIDDPPHPENPVDMANLLKTKRLPLQLQSIFEEPKNLFNGALFDFEQNLQYDKICVPTEVERLQSLWEGAASWFSCQAEYFISDHTDRLFVNQVLLTRRDTCIAHSQELKENRNRLTVVKLLREYRSLAGLFNVEITSFERKRFINLSHEPNKAMNLNSYISLVGNHYRIRRTKIGSFLEPVDPTQAELSIPDTDYFISLDADSVLLPNYALHLTQFMEQPGNERIAVAQTPYSSFPGSAKVIERIAGATTDIQYIIHQGFTEFRSTFWVGANALIRRAALEEIVETDMERGYPIKRFIQDNTVIEDTESSVDLVNRGWQLYNYPERLSYSATPPDFGALIIQRRRWANGGILIFPKLLRYLTQSPKPHQKIVEGLIRSHYLISIALVNFGLLVILTFPLTESVRSLWLPLTALPYFYLYGRDLVLSGYCKTDLLRVYALNLLLIPINLAGVFKSLQQAITGKKTPFGRTPKVNSRTTAAPIYILIVYGLFLVWIFGSIIDIFTGHYIHALFALFNAILLFYAIAFFIGFQESFVDLMAGFQKRRQLTRLSSRSN